MCSAIYLLKQFFKLIISCYYEQDNQGDLEMATEMLSEYMERDITNSSLQDLKIIVMDKTK